MELTSEVEPTFCDVRSKLQAESSVQVFEAIGVASLSSFSAAKKLPTLKAIEASKNRGCSILTWMLSMFKPRPCQIFTRSPVLAKGSVWI